MAIISLGIILNCFVEYFGELIDALFERSGAAISTGSCVTETAVTISDKVKVFIVCFVEVIHTCFTSKTPDWACVGYNISYASIIINKFIFNKHSVTFQEKRKRFRNNSALALLLVKCLLQLSLLSRCDSILSDQIMEYYFIKSDTINITIKIKYILT